MPSFNKVILMGNLTRDPELRYTPKGTAVAKIGMAINRHWKDENGNQKEDVTFVDVDAFGRQAEVISQYLKKGRPILVEGRLKLDQWDDKQTNQKRSRLGVVLESFQFLDSGGTQAPSPRPSPTGGEGGPKGGPIPADAHRAPSNAPNADLPPDAEDDVPF